MQLRDERPGDAAARYAGVVGHGASKINGFGHRVPTSGRKRPWPSSRYPAAHPEPLPREADPHLLTIHLAGAEIGGAALDGRSLLAEIASEGTPSMLVAALETEVAALAARQRYRARCRRPCLGRSQGRTRGRSRPAGEHSPKMPRASATGGSAPPPSGSSPRAASYRGTCGARRRL